MVSEAVYQDVLIDMPGLHPGQLEVLASPARFKVCANGRRWGKTRFGVATGIRCAAKGGRAWWVTPTYKYAMVGWRDIKLLARQIPGFQVRESDWLITLPGGGTIQARSADNPDSLRGDSADLVILDEAAFMAEEVWTEALRPTLVDRLGKAIFLSTPNGLNWFWRIWCLGQDPGNPEWQSWSFPTSSNPYIPASEIEAARTTMPARLFEQEFLAQFISDHSGVFRRIEEAAIAVPAPHRAGHTYVLGVDWGKHHDFTVLSMLDAATGEQVALDRFNQIDYHVQVARLRLLYDAYRPALIVAEANSMGEPIVEQLQRQHLPVWGFRTSNTSKGQAIEALALAFEQGSLKILPDPVQKGELQAFQTERLPSGLMRYRAPDGLHDDTVIALALAWAAVGAAGDALVTTQNFAFED